MRYFQIPLREDDPRVYLDAYISDLAEPVRDAMLVIPGGGYAFVCTDREGDAIALSYVARGINAFVLHYSICCEAVYPRPLVDASLAMIHIRRHAKEYHIRPDRVFAVGFSAGGHLAASLGTFWHRPELKQAIPDMEDGENRPTGTVLCYPVITGGEYAHSGSFQMLLGKEHPSKEELDYCSVEKHVDSRTSPAFLMHTADDNCVPVENTLLMAAALSSAKVPFEVHIYPSAPHGGGLMNDVTPFGYTEAEQPGPGHWLEQSITWIKLFK